MCGRYALDTDPEVIRATFRLGAEFSQTRLPPPRWNVAPTDLTPIVVQRRSGRDLVPARWGFRPVWLPPKRPAPINARAETVMTSGLFKAALGWGRVAVVASHFYEWRAVAGQRAKQPYAIARADGRPLAFAGIATPGEEGQPPSYAILTTRPNTAVSFVHDRMPVVLDEEATDRWLDRGNGPLDVLDLLQPCPDGWLTLYQVSHRVGNVTNDDPELIRPVA
jgi:putative SOS response-associated peptidase YedK